MSHECQWNIVYIYIVEYYCIYPKFCTMLSHKLEQLHACQCLQIARWVANSADPDQMQQIAASDLRLHCLLPILGVEVYY